jgi:uncharacterized protein (DUF58 family)
MVIALWAWEAWRPPMAWLFPVGGVLFLWLLLSLAGWLRVVPHTTFIGILAVPVLISFGLVAWPQSDGLLAVVMGLNLAVLVLGAVDLFSLPRAAHFTIERETVRAASQGKAHPIVLGVNYSGKRRLRASVRDGLPQEFTATPDEMEFRLTPVSRHSFAYDIRSRRRGRFRLSRVHLQIDSRLRMWRKFIDQPADTEIHVYPDMKQLAQYALLARTNRLSLLGVRRTRRIGQDNDFERLRDYTPDDNPRHIDWRTTARRRKLTVKDFQTNQSQRLVFLVDCGRMMTNLARGVSLLDHAFNSMLLLAYVALEHGDSVGLLTFSDQVHEHVLPRSGRKQMNRLLHACFDRFPTRAESRYDAAFRHLGAHPSKRSLVILITNLVDEVNAMAVSSYLTQLAGRHLPLGVWLRDHSLFDAVAVEHPRGKELFRAAAASDILLWRHHVMSDLKVKGVLSLDVFPEDLTAPLVNRYLEIKARHLL